MMGYLIGGLWVFAVGTGVIFGWRYQQEKRRLSNGIWFNLCFWSVLAAIGVSILISQVRWLMVLAGVFLVLVLGVIAVFYAFQAVLLLWNALIVWRRESHSLANLLTLFLGIMIMIAPLFSKLLTTILPKPFDFGLNVLGILLFSYVLVWFYNYLTMLVLYQFNRPKFDQDYIIVLGSGLLNGDQVPPLLQQRIQRGLSFQRQQQAVTGKIATMIFSGGQGPDETVPEGVAMRQYALAQGLAPEQAIAEPRSRTTLENMRFSKQIITQHGPKLAQTIFVTNNYHTFRAGLYAREVGLKADGLGAHTAHFFLPNAVLREYVAIFVQYKKWHLIAGAVFVLVAVLQTWLQFQFVHQP